MHYQWTWFMDILYYTQKVRMNNLTAFHNFNYSLLFPRSLIIGQLTWRFAYLLSPPSFLFILWFCSAQFLIIIKLHEGSHKHKQKNYSHSQWQETIFYAKPVQWFASKFANWSESIHTKNSEVEVKKYRNVKVSKHKNS